MFQGTGGSWVSGYRQLAKVLLCSYRPGKWLSCRLLELFQGSSGEWMSRRRKLTMMGVELLLPNTLRLGLSYRKLEVSPVRALAQRRR